jgi:hypothetical protein
LLKKAGYELADNWEEKYGQKGSGKRGYKKSMKKGDIYKCSFS